MAWWCREPSHQKPWFWHSLAGIWKSFTFEVQLTVSDNAIWNNDLSTELYGAFDLFSTATRFARVHEPFEPAEGVRFVWQQASWCTRLHLCAAQTGQNWPGTGKLAGLDISTISYLPNVCIFSKKSHGIHKKTEIKICLPQQKITWNS